MWILEVVGRLLLPRWPVLIVAPVLAGAGYTGWQMIGLTVLAIVLAELALAFVKVVPLDRE